MERDAKSAPHKNPCAQESLQHRPMGMFKGKETSELMLQLHQEQLQLELVPGTVTQQQIIKEQALVHKQAGFIGSGVQHKH